ncbi:DNA photolyase [Trichoderma reesei QM6a]|uniref:DNA photolyase n=2 Tax=Hypocrea jecorina TaxID=51453 RepID=G0RI60_HYPJQ|nr:DNA photolyase [Trichoderma reesei QM6a]EGR48899.1 DNA photolyase [Trichoderma reesei QM6a]ETS02597.1 Cryptochrome/photolyase FAD-binding domain-containing protein [Trichoderma reesei RUT C-30]
MTKPRVIYWFRTDLRLHDSPALQAALDLEPEALWPIWTWDPHYVYKARVGVNRFQFLLDCQNDLSQSITKLNKKSKLFVLREGPQTLFPKLFEAWKPTHLVFEKDTDTYARTRDEAVVKAAKEAGVEVITRSGRTLWDSDEIVAHHDGKPTMTIAALQAAGKKIGPVAKPIPAPKSLPDPGDMPVDFEQHRPDPKPDINESHKTREDTAYKHISGPNGDFAIETLEELGFAPATTPIRGGETLALERLDELIKDKTYIATFKKPKTSPAQFDPPATTLLSPFFHFGALSVRLFYHRVQEVIDSFGPGASSPPESLIGQVLFRDMYFAAQAALGASFAQTATNPYCRFVPWHLPSKRDPHTGLTTGDHHIDSDQAETWFRRWKAGTTGFPWIDALMRQLRHDGWIHHLGRHSVACFLTRGGCYVDWERGAEVFEELLLDHEPACNIGNWQWLSCVAFFAQYYRVYSPVSFGQKWDRDGALIRRWVPELRNVKPKYIYEPWKMPLPDQKAAGVRITGDGLEEQHDEGTYPKPMFDFSERRGICIGAMKNAYSVGLHGNDEQVLDGSWRSLFPSPHEAEVMGEYESDFGENADNNEDGDHIEKQNGEGAGHKRGAETNGVKAKSKKQKTQE